MWMDIFLKIRINILTTIIALNSWKSMPRNLKIGLKDIKSILIENLMEGQCMGNIIEDILKNLFPSIPKNMIIWRTTKIWLLQIWPTTELIILKSLINIIEVKIFKTWTGTTIDWPQTGSRIPTLWRAQFIRATIIRTEKTLALDQSMEEPIIN